MSDVAPAGWQVIPATETRAPISSTESTSSLGSWACSCWSSSCLLPKMDVGVLGCVLLGCCLVQLVWRCYLELGLPTRGPRIATAGQTALIEMDPRVVLTDSNHASTGATTMGKHQIFCIANDGPPAQKKTEPKQPKHLDEEQRKWWPQLLGIYRKYSPTQVPRLPELIEKHKGHLKELFNQTLVNHESDRKSTCDNSSLPENTCRLCGQAGHMGNRSALITCPYRNTSSSSSGTRRKRSATPDRDQPVKRERQMSATPGQDQPIKRERQTSATGQDQPIKRERRWPPIKSAAAASVPFSPTAMPVPTMEPSMIEPSPTSSAPLDVKSPEAWDSPVPDVKSPEAWYTDIPDEKTPELRDSDMD